MASWSVTLEKVMSCVPEAPGGDTQQVACWAVIWVPSANVVALAIAAKDRHITIMPVASRGSVRLIDLTIIRIPSLLYPGIYSRMRAIILLGRPCSL